jgi:adenine-specific DNA glycosylase
VDGNVVRVFSRLRAIEELPSASLTKLHWRLADTLVRDGYSPTLVHEEQQHEEQPHSGRQSGRRGSSTSGDTLRSRLRPGDLNQALMDLGATVCTAKSPSCAACPLASVCRARLNELSHHSSSSSTSHACSSTAVTTVGRTKSEGENAHSVTRYPRKAPKKQPRPETAHVCIVQRTSDSRFLLERRPPTGMLAGLWQFPTLLRDEESRPPTTPTTPIAATAITATKRKRTTTARKKEKAEAEAHQKRSSVGVMRAGHQQMRAHVAQLLGCAAEELQLLPPPSSSGNCGGDVTGTNTRVTRLPDVGQQRREAGRGGGGRYVGTLVHLFSHIRQRLMVEWWRVVDPTAADAHGDGANGGGEEHTASAQGREGQESAGDSWEPRWLDAEQVKQAAISTGTRKVFRLLEAQLQLPQGQDPSGGEPVPGGRPAVIGVRRRDATSTARLRKHASKSKPTAEHIPTSKRESKRENTRAHTTGRKKSKTE